MDPGGTSARAARPTDDARGADRAAFRRSCSWLFLLVLAVYGLSPVVTNGDGYLYVPTAASIVHQGNLDLDEFSDAPIVDALDANGRYAGHRLNKFPWAVSVFAIPAVIAWDAGHLVGIGPGSLGAVQSNEIGPLAFGTAILVAAASALAIAVLANDRLGGSTRGRRRRAIAIAIVYAFGTSAWSTSSRGLWQHGPSVLLITIGLIAVGRLHTSNRNDEKGRVAYAVTAGASLAFAVAIRPTGIIPFLLIALWAAFQPRFPRSAFGIGVSAIAIPWFTVTWLSYGQPFQEYTSASRLAIHAAFPEALAANLISPARGLLVFSPIILLAIPGAVLAFRRRGMPDPLMWVSLFAVPAYWLTISAFGENWIGGNSYGPRFFTDALPFLVVLAIPAVDALASASPGVAKRLMVLALTAAALWGAFVHGEGAILRAAQCWNTDPTPIVQDTGRIWSWSDPPFLRGVHRLLDRSVHDALFEACPGLSDATGL